jgi:hypothetical protein
MMGFAIADSVPRYDIELSCNSKLLIFYKRQLLLHGWFLVAGFIIAGSVPVYDTRLSCYSKVLIIYHIYLALDR